jgi:phage baseplate assembly protein gpV
VHLALQVLEDRTAPATISWINAAGGAWEDANNWDLGRTPQPDDDVVIRTLDFGATISHATGQDTVQSISSSLEVGTLAVTDSSSLLVAGAAVMPILAARTGGVITAHNKGILTMNLWATDGGEIHLPSVTGYQSVIFTSIEADGAGAFIDLPALTTLLATTGQEPQGEVRLDLIADQGGTINLPALTSVRGHPPDYVVGSTTLWARRGGTFLFDTNATITFDADGTLNVDPESDVQAGNIVVAATNLTVDGSLEAASMVVRGSVTISGTLTVSGAYTLNHGQTLLQAGMVVVGDRLDNQGGFLFGSGMISGDVNNAGVFDVGGLTVDGNYTQQAAGQLSLRLRSATDFDQLVVTGFATLDGTLNAILAGGYQPQQGDQLQVVQFGAGTGTFRRVQVDAPLFGVLYVYLPGHGVQPGVTLLF